MIENDFHMHSNFSEDSDTPMEAMIQGAIAKGLKRICITDHMDYDFPKCYHPMTFEFNTEEQKDTLFRFKDKYQSQIEIYYGIELGMRPYLAERCSSLVHTYPYDFILCSTHLVYDLDPYYPESWNGHSEQELIKQSFLDIYENINCFDDFDSYGHLDYVVRYAPSRCRQIRIRDYYEILEAILKALIKKEKSLEINTAGYKYGLGHPHPQEEILSLYHSLGGRLLTIGSDAHKPEHIAYDFNKTDELLYRTGFREYNIYVGRKPVFFPIRFS